MTFPNEPLSRLPAQKRQLAKVSNKYIMHYALSTWRLPWRPLPRSPLPLLLTSDPLPLKALSPIRPSGFLKRVRSEMRRFNIVGDTTKCKAKVVRKYVNDKTALVDIEIAAENQRGEVTTPGLATVALPSRDVKLPAFVDGAQVDLELPLIR
jgi:hypothetical protein